MSPTAYTPEADIAVLKEQLLTLNARVHQVAEQQASNFGALNARFDTLTPLVQDITRLQERHDGHGKALDHAFELIRAQDQNSGVIEADIRAYRAEHAKEHGAIEKRFNTQRGWFLAAGVFTTAVLAMLVWVAQLFIGQVQTNTDRIRDAQVDLLQHKLDEANRGKAP